MYMSKEGHGKKKSFNAIFHLIYTYVPTHLPPTGCTQTLNLHADHHSGCQKSHFHAKLNWAKTKLQLPNHLSSIIVHHNTTTLSTNLKGGRTLHQKFHFPCVIVTHPKIIKVSIVALPIRVFRDALRHTLSLLHSKFPCIS